MSERPVLCFGEMLWDSLPEGLFPGGAPMNVAYHLHSLGCPVGLISCVGRDLLGDELLQRVTAWSLSTDGIVRHHHLPTGWVRARLNSQGAAEYDIITGVAWDEITLTDSARAWAQNATALVYGSLAQRSPVNQSTLAELMALLPEDAWRVLDVNLRPPHDQIQGTELWIQNTDLLKLNHEEAARLSGQSEPKAAARHLAEHWHARRVCVTCGASGAGLLIDHTWLWEPGQPVEVIDTVGAGDSFLAALLCHLLNAVSPDEALRRAARRGERVAGLRGATPPLSLLNETPTPGESRP